MRGVAEVGGSRLDDAVEDLVGDQVDLVAVDPHERELAASVRPHPDEAGFQPGGDRIGALLSDLVKVPAPRDGCPDVCRERDVARADLLRALLAAAAHERGDPRRELRRVVRLGDVVVRARLECLDDVLLAPVDGQHEHRQRDLGVGHPQRPADLEPGHPRELPVEDDGVGDVSVGDAFEHGGPIEEGLHVMGRRERPARHLRRQRAVFEDPDLSAITRHLPPV